MLNEQKNACLSLEQENKSLRCDLAQVAAKIVALEEQVFALEDALQKMIETPSADKIIFGQEVLSDAPDSIKLVRENVCMRAKLDYVIEAITRIEEALLHLSDVLE